MARCWEIGWIYFRTQEFPPTKLAHSQKYPQCWFIRSGAAELNSIPFPVASRIGEENLLPTSTCWSPEHLRGINLWGLRRKNLPLFHRPLQLGNSDDDRSGCHRHPGGLGPGCLDRHPLTHEVTCLVKFFFCFKLFLHRAYTGLFVLIFVFSISCNWLINYLPIVGFVPQISSVGSDGSALDYFCSTRHSGCTLPVGQGNY